MLVDDLRAKSRDKVCKLTRFDMSTKIDKEIFIIIFDRNLRAQMSKSMTENVKKWISRYIKLYLQLLFATEISSCMLNLVTYTLSLVKTVYH